MPRSTRWPRRVGAGSPRLLLLGLLVLAGCFQIDDQGEDALAYLPWNPPPAAPTVPPPVLGADAAPPSGQDAGGPPVVTPPADAGADAFFQAPGLAATDAGNSFARDGGANDGAAGVSDTGLPTARPTALNFSVLTTSLGGRYAPRNVGAIWIENATGKWIKTLAVWAFIRERYLTRFRAASGGNRVDAVTSATLARHSVHDVSWDLTDAAGAPVPDGDYRVVVETTDRDATGDSTEVAFTKGALPMRLMPPDTTHYVNMSLALE